MNITVVGGVAAVFPELGTLRPVLAILVILKTLMEAGLATWASGSR
jgi:hypothetical protein